MRLERIPWSGADAPAEPRLHRRLVDEGFEVLRWHDAPGAHYAPHSHDEDETVWIVDGDITFDAGGGTFRLGAGDRLMLPAATVHTARAGDDGATYLIGRRRG